MELSLISIAELRRLWSVKGEKEPWLYDAGFYGKQRDEEMLLMVFVNGYALRSEIIDKFDSTDKFIGERPTGMFGKFVFHAGRCTVEIEDNKLVINGFDGSESICNIFEQNVIHPDWMPENSPLRKITKGYCISERLRDTSCCIANVKRKENDRLDWNTFVANELNEN